MRQETFMSLWLAQREMVRAGDKYDREDVIRLAAQYGKNLGVTEADCEDMITLKLEQIFHAILVENNE